MEMIERVGIVTTGKDTYVPNIWFEGEPPVAIASARSSGTEVLLKCHSGLEEFEGEKRALETVGGWPAVRLLDASKEDLVLVLEYHRGRDLRSSLVSGPLEAFCGLYLVGYVAGMMAELEAGGIYHGDIKPANLLVPLHIQAALEQGRLEQRVVDEGLALCDFEHAWKVEAGRMVAFTERGGRIVGTPYYMSPETMRDAYGKRSDVYSLALIAWQVFEERDLFEGTQNLTQVLNRILLEFAPHPPQFTARLYGAEQVLQAAFSGEPERRPGSEEIVDLIAKILKERARINLKEALASAKGR